jgi:hypothetical protein
MTSTTHRRIVATPRAPIVLSALAALCALCAQAQPGSPKPADKPIDAWRGWWFIVHKDAQGRWTPDKFAVAVVIDDRIADVGSQRTTGQWVGCVWSLASDIKARGKLVTLRFAQDGHHRFRIERTGPDEAQGYYLDDPRRRLVMQRWRHHDECAGYFP